MEVKARERNARHAKAPAIVAYPAFKNRASNPFQYLLYTQVAAKGWRVYDFSEAIRKFVNPSIVHLHWPEGFVFHRSLLKSIFRWMLLAGLMRAYSLMGARIVWTAHNTGSHENHHPKTERLFWKWFYGRLDAWISLSQCARERVSAGNQLALLPHAVIPHGLYPSEYNNGRPEADEARVPVTTLLCFGKLRAYKKVPELVQAFEGLNKKDVQLRVVGRCEDAGLDQLLREKVQTVTGLHYEEGRLGESEIEDLFHQVSAVVISYSETLNSGVAFLSLSNGKPIIAPDTPAFKEIQDEFGHSMVRLYAPPISSDGLSACLEQPFEPDSIPRDVFVRRSWPVIAEEHLAFFEEISGVAE